MRMGFKTKIDWCDSSWNPVTGCYHGCEYCYARRIAERFNGAFGTGNLFDLKEPIRDEWKDEETGTMVYGKKEAYPFGFTPTLHRYRLEEIQKWTQPRTIFVCSMADLFGNWVPDEWIKAVFDSCEKAPQHRYLFLTKNPERYMKLLGAGILPHSDNFWFGSTTPYKCSQFWSHLMFNTFLSIEPIMEPFTGLGEDNAFVNWIIVGAETGNRKGRVVPEKGWIMELVNSCARTRTPIFMKESLREIMGDDFKQEFPWQKDSTTR